MDPNRMTEKAQDAVRQAQSLAQRHGHQQGWRGSDAAFMRQHTGRPASAIGTRASACSGDGAAHGHGSRSE